MPSRRKTREFVLQVLFAADSQNRDPVECLDLLGNHFTTDEEQVIRMDRVMTDFARQLVAAVSKNKGAIDELISKQSHHWKLHRMNKVDRNILRMAIAEIVCFPEIPPAVSLNEAIDLGKKYGAENSPAFINGILDRLHSIRTTCSSEPKFQDILEWLDESGTTD